MQKIAEGDQTATAIVQLATFQRTHYDALIERGFDYPTALYLVIETTKAVLALGKSS